MPMQNVSAQADQKPEITSSFLAIVMNMFKSRGENLLLKNKLELLMERSTIQDKNSHANRLSK